MLSLLGRRDLSRNIRPLAVLALTTGCSFYFSPQAFFCGRAAFEMASSGTLCVRKLLPPLCFCCSHIFYSPSPNSVPRSHSNSSHQAGVKGTMCQYKHTHTAVADNAGVTLCPLKHVLQTPEFPTLWAMHNFPSFGGVGGSDGFLVLGVGVVFFLKRREKKRKSCSDYNFTAPKVSLPVNTKASSKPGLSF